MTCSATCVPHNSKMIGSQRVVRVDFKMSKNSFVHYMLKTPGVEGEVKLSCSARLYVKDSVWLISGQSRFSALCVYTFPPKYASNPQT